MAAKRLVMVRPLPFTVSASVSMSNTGNLLTPDPKEVASIAGGANTIDIDLGSNQSLDTFFLGYLSASITGITFKGGTVTSTDTTYATAVPTEPSALVNPNYHVV